MLGTLTFYPLGSNTLEQVSSPDEPETIQGQQLKEIFQRATSLGYLTTGVGSLVPISKTELLCSQFRAEPFALEMDLLSKAVLYNSPQCMFLNYILVTALPLSCTVDLCIFFFLEL